ncbi:MAG TPA: hypothetical protein PKL24_21985 [Polyangiaceae bacterium]|nr:MAG: Cytochrome c [Deltaproteobacteria bacterium ADurb.Bin207]HNZ24830.1 hypothetical protein [Polyangiaceae bacterium]HOD22038.1 hypothetical protein [Polyangiaceae bacterium]HOE50666.1 hypothetical protein [Polyangiaceae bacterium]HOH02100.1 hypothetical protein [Polyangiaceae bacterium]
MKAKPWLGAVLGLAGTLVVALAYEKTHPAAWQSVQLAYSDRLVDAGWPPVSVGVRSLRAPGGGSEDRCVTCHLGMALPAAFEAPFQRHPHTSCALGPAEQGCTACHRGEPLGLTQADAHASRTPTPRAMLSGGLTEHGVRTIEAGCATCHVDRSTGVLRYDPQRVPDIARGLEVFIKQGCRSCHALEGVAAFGEAGPALGRVGRRRTAAFLRSRLRFPQRGTVASPMPPLAVPDADAERLELFLMAQIGPEHELGTSPAEALLAATTIPRPIDHFPENLPLEPTAASGALWMHAVGCIGCHRLDDDGVGVPDLRRVGWYATAERLRTALEHPEAFAPGSYMPVFDLPPTALGAVLAYLSLQRTLLPSAPERVLAEVCGPCHGPARDPKVVVLATQPPDMVEMAARLAPEEFAKVAEEGREGTAMAPWGKVLARPFLAGLHGRIAGQGGSP